jgi:hypothetical protein
VIALIGPGTPMGERYPCRDDIFRATYEPVDGEAAHYLLVYTGEA